MKSKLKTAIYLTAVLCALVSAEAQFPTTSPATATAPLEVGDLPLIFGEGVDPAKLDALVADTRKRASEMRAQGFKEALAMDPAKATIPFSYDCIIAALKTGERAKEANAWIRNYSHSKEVDKRGNQKKLGERAISLLTMFGKDGKYPGNLEADVEADLKTQAWEFCCNLLDPKGPFVTKMSEKAPYDILPLTWGRQWGTENQDIRMRPYVYLALSVLHKDPAYSAKTIGDKTVEEWFGLMSTCMKDYLKDRILAGLWIEPGGHYAHINFDVMIDLYETSPDPEVRQRAKMFLDLALIEDEQISVNGLHGGARSRTGVLAPDTSDFKDLVFGDKPGFLLSDYQAPAVAIVLRHAKGAVKPYHIYNRVPGENAPPAPNFVHNSHLVSYAYRTPGYLMGTALRDPNRIYHPSSDQMRTSSVIFQTNEAVFPNPKVDPHKEGSGRAFNEQWSVQSDGSMIVQKLLKSQFVDRMDTRLTGDLKITEREGWIFAEAGSGYAAVRFVDPQAPSGAGKYSWSEIPAPWKQKDKPGIKVASPERDFLPIIIQAGDPGQYGSFEKFQAAVLASKITINTKANEFEYQMAGGPMITWNYNQEADPLVLPKVNGKIPDLLPPLLFDSPFLKAKWEDPKIYAGAGPFRAVYDIEKCTVTESKK